MDDMVWKLDPECFSCLEYMKQGTVNNDEINLFTSSIEKYITMKEL